MGGLGIAKLLGSCGVTAGVCAGPCGCPQWGEEGGSEHPLKQDRFQHFPFHSTRKLEVEIHHNLGTSVLAVDGSGFGLKARDGLKTDFS